MGSTSGFTLIELMIVVAIIGVLAAVGVSAYRKWVRKAKASGEVPGMLGQFQVREEQYFAETGEYLPTGTSDTNIFPTTPGKAGSYVNLGTLPDAWKTLKIQPGSAGLYCGYVVRTFAAGTAPSGAAALVYTTTPTRPYFIVRAECDWDGSSTVNNVWVVAGDRALSTASQTGEGR
jgi:prepilin-type N-terminal cleavage/methylation domain-containing protein